MLNDRAHSALINFYDYFIYLSKLGRFLFASLLLNAEVALNFTLGQNFVLMDRADDLSMAVISLSKPAVSTSFGSMPIISIFFSQYCCKSTSTGLKNGWLLSSSVLAPFNETTCPGVEIGILL